MRIIFKRHAAHPNIMSADVTLIKTKKHHITLQEYYDPHYVEIRLWIRDDVTSLFTLKKWYKVPLSKEAREILKQVKAPGNIDAIAKLIRQNKKG